MMFLYASNQLLYDLWSNCFYDIWHIDAELRQRYKIKAIWQEEIK